MRFGFAAVTARFAFPTSSVGSPLVIFVKCSPPSVLF